MASEKPNPQDKDSFVEYGADEEIKFVNQVAPDLGLEAEINPVKEDNPYAIDLIVDEHLTDLKKQETPFFTAEKQFDGADPQYTVTFNTNDFERYREKDADDIDIIFWVHWEELEGYGTKVQPMAGVWRVSFDTIVDWVESGYVGGDHEYKNRSEHDRHASSSFGLDLRDMEQLAYVGPMNNYQSGIEDSALFI